jgi:hypothetical protein
MEGGEVASGGRKQGRKEGREIKGERHQRGEEINT